ncbi:D-alanyl-D-alanine carboxypeptidase family protein [Pseudoclavibacter sp. CFCC 11306]|uniref:D-alanyl-D-alanine carboxypeptidase family protein n=1 Tax=Pseudoclavibacter sp. CFCC 11306 TaxID=1564493 RepID=UPI0013011C21|nr:hypothetical protein [Pseudoclavibacter sp. CFCC 11306]KAB1657472.1 hypothetical protein F8O09_07475 [Pseudoclavibacter sp. CFCC 11306]
MTRRRSELLAQGGAAALRPARGIGWPITVVVASILLALSAWVAWGPLPVQSASIAFADTSLQQTDAGAETADTAAAGGGAVAAADDAQPAAAQLAWPSTGAGAFVLRSLGDQPAASQVSVSLTHGEQKAYSIASVTKLVTALRVLDRRPLQVGDQGPSITMTQADEDLMKSYVEQNGSVEPVTVGASLSQFQVLELSLLPSSNNYTTTLATWAFGSVDDYLESTPAWLEANGLGGMTIADPTGIDERNQATPEQIVHLGELALANPVVRQIVSTSTADIPGVGEIKNHNSLLGQQGVDGLKTGSLANVFNLAYSAHFTVDGVPFELIGAALGSTEDHAKLQPEIGQLIQSIRQSIISRDVLVAGESAGTLTTSWGASTDAQSAATVHVLSWRGTPVTGRFVGASVQAGARAGSQVGTVLIERAGEQVGSAPLLISQSIDDPGLDWRIANIGLLPGPAWSMITGQTGS